ncbi:hypothetical protein PR048_000640 [Dryococelus australis]|uniref:Ig-like domain-containing protein n=1 Tax=Dryococelus australis TaxID=614101 RepID=A0ABQ9IGM1_9NEOP|nr:hypothetical protein PR048_000640 [Dryococelus australis]
MPYLGFKPNPPARQIGGTPTDCAMGVSSERRKAYIRPWWVRVVLMSVIHWRCPTRGLHVVRPSASPAPSKANSAGLEREAPRIFQAQTGSETHGVPSTPRSCVQNCSVRRKESNVAAHPAGITSLQAAPAALSTLMPSPKYIKLIGMVEFNTLRSQPQFPLVIGQTVFDTSCRTLSQSSPSTLTAGNQCAVDIGILVHKTAVSSLQVTDLANLSAHWTPKSSRVNETSDTLGNTGTKNWRGRCALHGSDVTCEETRQSGAWFGISTRLHCQCPELLSLSGGQRCVPTASRSQSQNGHVHARVTATPCRPCTVFTVRRHGRRRLERAIAGTSDICQLHKNPHDGAEDSEQRSVDRETVGSAQSTQRAVDADGAARELGPARSRRGAALEKMQFHLEKQRLVARNQRERSTSSYSILLLRAAAGADSSAPRRNRRPTSLLAPLHGTTRSSLSTSSRLLVSDTFSDDDVLVRLAGASDLRDASRELGKIIVPLSKMCSFVRNARGAGKWKGVGGGGVEVQKGGGGALDDRRQMTTARPRTSDSQCVCFFRYSSKKSSHVGNTANDAVGRRFFFFPGTPASPALVASPSSPEAAVVWWSNSSPAIYTRGRSGVVVKLLACHLHPRPQWCGGQTPRLPSTPEAAVVWWSNSSPAIYTRGRSGVVVKLLACHLHPRPQWCGGQTPRLPSTPEAAVVWWSNSSPAIYTRGRSYVVVKLLACHLHPRPQWCGGQTPRLPSTPEAAVVWWSNSSPPTNSSRIRFPAEPQPGFSHAGIALDNVAGLRGFLADLRFRTPVHSGAAPYSPRSTLIVSQNQESLNSRKSQRCRVPNTECSYVHLGDTLYETVTVVPILNLKGVRVTFALMTRLKIGNNVISSVTKEKLKKPERKRGGAKVGG